MDQGHITQLATSQLGPSKVCYHQDLTRPPGAATLKVDDIGAGNYVLVDSGIANSNPSHASGLDGLRLSIERPAGASGNMGHWAAANVQNATLPDAFLIVATFARPVRVSLNANPPSGVYAPSLLMNLGAGTLMGVTSQFRPEGIRMNLPGTGVVANRPPITQTLADQIIDASHPSPFTLALTVTRTATGATGKGFLFVGNTEADAFAFTFTNLSLGVPILDIRAGIGTASGVECRASVTLLTLQIWRPKP